MAGPRSHPSGEPDASATVANVVPVDKDPGEPTRNDRPSRPRDEVVREEPRTSIEAVDLREEQLREVHLREVVDPGFAGTELDLSGRHAAVDVSVRRRPADDTMQAPEGKLPEEARPPAMPTASERYRLGREIGRGGMGRVVEAYDTQLGRSVALKEVLPPRSGVATGTHRRFAREVRLTARLEHPSIVPLYDSGIGPEGRPFYVMRRVDKASSLDELIAKARNLDERLTLIPHVLAAIDAIAHAHIGGVIHRDIKPQNILVGKLGETVVIDWGLAKVIGEADSLGPEDQPNPGDSLRTQIGSVFGTPGFMAPEQARGEELGTQGDVYALGAVLYQLLAGSPPHSGNSATEVIERTSKHEVKRLDQVAPGVPPDLVTIVGKALALDREARYRDASALAEDLRRFLDGQLVAAHSYTKRQRLARFARRHRAALSVLAVATVAVAVMAWIGVARIVRERDDAADARAIAEQQRAAAEDARDRLADRHDLLVVMQATALLEQNATEALAVLKQLPATSKRIGDARAIAQAAVMRGVGWAVQGPAELPVHLELDPTGHYLAHVTDDAFVRVWDLEKRRMIVQRKFGKYARATWVLGGRLLVTSEAVPPELFDPLSNASEKLPLPPTPGLILGVSIASAGDRVVLRTAPSGAIVYDIAAKTSQKIPYEGPIEGVQMAPDASWIAIKTHGKKAAAGAPAFPEELIVYDGKLAELTRLEGDFTPLLAASRGKRFAAWSTSRVVECRLDQSPPVWHDVPLELGPRSYVWMATYRGDELGMYIDGELRGWRSPDPKKPDPKADPKKPPPLPRTYVMGRASFMNGILREVADETYLWATPDGRLHFANGLIEGNINIPIDVGRTARFAGRAGVSRVVVVGEGVLVGFELDNVLARAVKSATTSFTHFIDDNTLLMTRQATDEWHWVDLRTWKRSTIKYSPVGMLSGNLYDRDETDGRALLRESSPRGVRVLSLRKGAAATQMVVDDRDAWARLIPGDAILFGVGDGRVMVRVGDERERELVKLDGTLANVISLGHMKFAAKSNAGEIVRGDLASSKIERTRVPPTRGALGVDPQGRVLLTDNKRLLVWDTSVREIAAFDRAIVDLAPVEGGIGVTLEGGEARVVDLRNGGVAVHRVLAPGRYMPQYSSNGKLIANLDSVNRTQLIDMPSRAHWSLPTLRDANQVLGVSPNGRRILQSSSFLHGVWQLPEVPSDPSEFPGWLTEQTNATVDKDGILVWPWQRTP